MEQRKERPQVNRIFPREMIRQCLKENDLRNGKSILVVGQAMPDKNFYTPKKNQFKIHQISSFL